METNYYQATRGVAFSAPELDQDLEADAVIVGGGISGVSAALHLAERGYKPVLLEAQDVGWGASGRNGGQALPGFGASMHKMVQLVGQGQAKMLWDMSVEAVDLLHARIQRHQIPCAPHVGYLHAALKPRQVRELKEEQDELDRLGAPVGRLLEGAELSARLNSPRYIAALEDKLAGHVHPLNYTLGLAKAAQEAGARIYVRSPVTRVEHGPRVTLHVGGHKVRAKFLIIAGGAYLNGLEQKIDGYIMPVGTYVMATEPRADVRDLIPGNEAVADVNFVLDYFRRSPDDRMLFGGRVSYSTLPPPNLGAAMLKRAVAVFPQLKDARVEYAWGGFVDITRNRAPHFGRLADNILFLQGFSGHGLALTGLAGKLAAEVVAGQAGRFDVFTRIPHARFPGGRLLRTPALVLATTWFRLRDML
ncbi:NAD(P)/FAD-dependent oxidoreductase [Acidocella sp.]|uniref:NAD(P)/FAD-dependent oxidoreductase n=1 Tax=Acidocella sp. TaxID=50710 RepID=UPI003CFE0B5E